MNKKRKYEPNQWSWTSQLYNASSIAQKATEQAAQVELMGNVIKKARKTALENQEYCKLLETSINTWESSHSQLEKKLQKSKELYASLLAENESLKTRQIAKEAENETLKSQLNAIKKELHSVKRECNENKARKKSWKKNMKSWPTWVRPLLQKSHTNLMEYHLNNFKPTRSWQRHNSKWTRQNKRGWMP